MTQQQTVWKCEQWLGGRIKEQKVFQSEQQAREFARRLAGVAPDLVLRIERCRSSMCGTEPGMFA